MVFLCYLLFECLFIRARNLSVKNDENIDCILRRAPEVISRGLYSHVRDVWSFGNLTWELFAAFYDSNIMPRQTIPYYNHTNDEVTPCKIFKFKIPIPQGVCLLKESTKHQDKEIDVTAGC